MPRTKRDVAELKRRAINSLVLGIELFNRPHEEGRPEGTLILLHHAFEMLLKAVIKDRTGTVHKKGDRYSYGFDKCLEVAQNEVSLISADDRRTLSILDAHRDTAVHYYQEISESLLYIQAQAAVTIFDDLLKNAFKERLGDLIPERVLPISTRPPEDLQVLLDSELSQIDALLRPGSRKGIQATARLRSIMALATASRDEAERVTEREIRRAIGRRRKGEHWKVIIPEVAQLKINTKAEGMPFYLRISKGAEMAVRVAKEGEPAIGTLIKQEVNIWDRYNLGRDDLAKKLGLTGPRTSALILELKLKDDDECFRVLRRKSSKFNGYSKKALDLLRQALADRIDVDAVWQKHRHRFGARRRAG